jgi:translation elongation factor EF-1alpha
MLRCASLADAAIVVVSAAAEDTGKFTDYIPILKEAVSLGIEKLIVVINKLDLEKWAFARFQEIVKNMKEMLKNYFPEQNKHNP